jgi:hypothetical protein
VEHSKVEGLFPIDPGGVTIQVVTSTNHLDVVDLMVLLGVGGSYVLLCGYGVPGR